MTRRYTLLKFQSPQFGYASKQLNADAQAIGLEEDNTKNIEIKDAQSDNPETNAKYRNGHAGSSALVKDIYYDGKNQILKVKYRDNFTATYKDIDPNMAAEFAKADSKGRYALANLWGLPYNE